jgi:hypothetical protein
MKRKVIFAADSVGQSDARATTREELINCYAEPQAEAARSGLIIRPCPTDTAFATGLAEGNTGLAVVGAAEVAPLLYVMTAKVVAGAATYWIDSIDTGGTVTNVDKFTSGTSVDTRGVFSVNVNHLTATVNGTYRVKVIGGSGSFPGSGAFSSHTSVTFIDNYTLISEVSGRKWEFTDIADPTSRDALQFYTKEANMDRILRVAASRSRIYVIGQLTTEVWYPTGDAEDPFRRVPGAVFNVGGLSRGLVHEGLDRVFFVTNDLQIVAMSGTESQVISNQAVHSDMRAELPSKIFHYAWRGRKFLVVDFDSRPAWCYDTTTNLWHKRGDNDGTGAWDVLYAVPGLAAAGNQEDYYFIKADGSVRRVGGTPSASMKRIMRSRPLDIDGNRFRVASFEFRVQPDASSAITATFKTSGDGGQTWTTGRAQTIAAGAYRRTPPFRALGSFRQFTGELTIESAAEAPVEASGILEVA